MNTEELTFGLLNVVGWDRDADLKVAQAVGFEACRFTKAGYRQKKRGESHWCSLPRYTLKVGDALLLFEDDDRLDALREALLKMQLDGDSNPNRLAIYLCITRLERDRALRGAA